MVKPENQVRVEPVGEDDINRVREIKLERKVLPSNSLSTGEVFVVDLFKAIPPFGKLPLQPIDDD